jgi:hypothetical protein
VLGWVEDSVTATTTVGFGIDEILFSPALPAIGLRLRKM